MACCGNCSTTKRVVWSFWALHFLISCVYMGVSLRTFHNFKSSFGRTYIYDEDPNKASKYENEIESSILGACMVGFLVVLFWTIYSFFILLGRSFTDLPLAYGIMVGTAASNGVFMVLAGLIVHQRASWVNTWERVGVWSSADASAFKTTFAFSYILCGTYIIMFFLLIFTYRSMSFSNARPDAADASKSSASMAMSVPSGRGGGGMQLGEPPKTMTWGAYGTTV